MGEHPDKSFEMVVWEINDRFMPDFWGGKRPAVTIRTVSQ
jgi:hypothetical protein